MRRLTREFTNFGRNILRPCPVILLLFTLSLAPAEAQTRDASPAPNELFDRIASLDAAFFDAYNACDIDKVGTFFAEDLEFYHEKGGLLLTRQSTLDKMRANLCAGGGYKLRRELVKGSVEVRPINNYGAVHTGEHRFYLTQKGQKEKLDGIGKFVMLWQRKDGEWRISRVISYGFRPPE